MFDGLFEQREEGHGQQESLFASPMSASPARSYAPPPPSEVALRDSGGSETAGRTGNDWGVGWGDLGDASWDASFGNDEDDVDQDAGDASSDLPPSYLQLYTTYDYAAQSRAEESRHEAHLDMLDLGQPRTIRLQARGGGASPSPTRASGGRPRR